MNIPDCYDAVLQAEHREAELDRREAMHEHCGCCGRVIGPERFLDVVDAFMNTEASAAKDNVALIDKVEAQFRK